MTLAIPPKRVQLYRVLWQRWIVVLRILFDLGAGAHPVKWRAVADTLLVDKKTAQKYLCGLVRDGHLAQAGEGYMLTQAGMSFLQETEGGEKFPLEGLNPGENFSPLGGGVVNVNPELVKLTPPTPEWGKNPGEKFSPLAKLMLAEIPNLFGGAVLNTDKLSAWANDEILLGWVAYAYDKRTSLAAPVGLMHYKLQREERPPMEYVKNYAAYLPDEFLINIGMQAPQAPDVVDEPVEMEQPVRELSEAESLLAEMAERSTDIAAVCITWSAVSFADGVLTLAVRDAQKQELWTRRLGATASQVLAEIVQAPARVEFVVAVETEREGSND